MPEAVCLKLTVYANVTQGQCLLMSLQMALLVNNNAAVILYAVACPPA